MATKRLLIPIAFLAALSLFALVLADDSQWDVNIADSNAESGSPSQLLNFTIINKNTNTNGTITINISIPAGFTFVPNSNQTGAANTSFYNTSSNVIWRNITAAGFLRPGQNASFVINVSVPHEIGTLYNFTIYIMANNTIGGGWARSSNGGNVIVNDTEPPLLTSINSPTASSPAKVKTGATVTIDYTYVEFNPKSAAIYLMNSTNDIVSNVFYNTTAISGSSMTGTTRTDEITIPSLADGFYGFEINFNDTLDRSENASSLGSIWIDNTAPVFDANAVLSPSILAPVNITTLNFSLTVNISESRFNNSNIQAVWYYFSTTGYSNSANTNMIANNLTTRQNVTNVVFNQTAAVNFINSYTGPGYHTVTFCANDTAGNQACSSPGMFIVKVVNISQVKNYTESLGLGLTFNITYENGTHVANGIMDPTLYNYTLRINTTTTTFVEIVGMTINETLMQYMGTTNLSVFTSGAVRDSMRASGYNATDFMWYNVESFLPAGANYKYGRIQLPRLYESVFYCSGSALSAATCAKISACTNTVNYTNYASIITTDSGCYNITELAGRTVLYVDHFSGGAGANDTEAPTISVSIPATGTWYKSSFTITANVTDATGVNSLNGTWYRVENQSAGAIYAILNWTQMTNSTFNSTSDVYTATFTISSIPDGNYSFRFNASDLSARVNTTINVSNIFIDDTPPTLSACSVSDVARGGTPTYACTGTNDNSLSFGGSAPTCTCSYDTSSAGLKTTTCYVTDTAGNPSSTCAATYTVTSTSTGATDTGGTTTTTTTSTVVTKTLVPGTVAVITGFGKVSISEADIEVTDTLTDVSIKIQKYDTAPSTITPITTGTVFSYMDITTTNLPAAKIKSAKLKFSVSKTWLDSNNANKNTVALNRYSGGKWNKLVTRLVKEDGIDMYYEADTPGFSAFAITAEKSTAAPAAAAPAAEAELAAATGAKGTPKISEASGIVLLGVAAAIGLYWFKFRKMKKPRFSAKKPNKFKFLKR